MCLADFAVESWRSLKFFVGHLRGKPATGSRTIGKPGFAQRATFSAAFLGLGGRARGIRIPRFHRSRGSMSEKVDSTMMPTKEAWEDSSDPMQVDLVEGERWAAFNEEEVV